LRHASLRGGGLIVLEQVRRQHFAITPRRGQVTDARCRCFQLFDSQATRAMAAAGCASAARWCADHAGLRVGAGTQARLTRQQANFQAQNMGYQPIIMFTP
jgi:hypothetical protein